MAPQWSVAEDRALLLALVQVMAPNGPSKNQFEAALKNLNDRWTLGACTQHYNKKLRTLDPATLDAGGANPSTPVRSSATKRKTPGSSKTAGEAASPVSRAGGRKMATAKSKAFAGGDAEEEDEQEPAVSKKAKVEDDGGEDAEE